MTLCLWSPLDWYITKPFENKNELHTLIPDADNFGINWIYSSHNPQHMPRLMGYKANQQFDTGMYICRGIFDPATQDDIENLQLKDFE